MKAYKSKIKRYIKEIFYFIITMSIVANLMSIYQSQSLNSEPLNIQTFHLINDQEYSVQNNKPVLIHFWATWCPTCKMEASNIDFLSKYYQVITIAVKSGSNKDIQNYLKEHNYHYKVVNDKEGRIAQQFKISTYPTTFIYDKEKKLRFSEVGYTSTPALWIRLLWAGNS